MRSCIETEIKPSCRKAVNTGIVIEIPSGYQCEVRPRSGLALNSGILIMNSPGTIDSDYRGEIKVIIFNASDECFFIKKGDRIAQLVLMPVIKANFINSDNLSDTSRGDGGFGHTGIS